MVTSFAHGALFGCGHLGCIAMMLIASCIPFPTSTPCNDMLAMLAYATHWRSMHLYTLPYMFMYESCLLVCRPCFNTMNLHFSIADTTFCLLSCLFAFSLACFLVLCLPYLSCLSALHLLCMHFESFLSIACLLVSCLYLCMYTHGVRMHGARARSPRRKQKGARMQAYRYKPSGYVQ